MLGIRSHFQNLKLLFLLGLLSLLLSLLSSAPKQVWRTAHDAPIDEVVYSADGKKLATTGGSFVQIWNEKDGRELARLEHPVDTRRVRFSPKGDRILTVCFTGGPGLGESRLWTASGRLLATLTSGKDDVAFAEFEPNGQRLATIATEVKERGHYELRIWDTQGHPLGRPYRKEGFVLSPPLFSPDGRYLVCQHMGRETLVMDARNGRELARIPSGRVFPTAAFSPDSQFLAVAESSGGISLLRTSDWSRVGGLADGQVILSLAYSVTGLLAVESCLEGEVLFQIWDPESRSPVGEKVSLHKSSVFPVGLQYTSDGRMVLSLAALQNSDHSLISVLDGRNGRLLSQKTLDHDSQGPNAKWLSNQKWVVSSVEDGLCVWNGSDGKPVCQIPTAKGPTRFAPSPVSERLAVGGRDRMLTLWSLR